MSTLIVFAHGKESGPWGSKIARLADIARGCGAQVMSPDYSDLHAPEDRVARLVGLELPAHTDLILVGSSMGAYVSAVASTTLRPRGLFLLAPAVGLPGYAPLPELHAQYFSIVMGWRDELIPVANVVALASTHRASLHLLDAGHRLVEVLDTTAELFKRFLETCMRATSTRPPALPGAPICQP